MDQPPWLARAWAELGQHEVAGPADNGRIVAFYRDAGHPEIRHDETAWCAAFAGACLARAGLAGTRSLMARSYLRWGVALDGGRFGALTVLSRGSDPALGHVGFLVGETDRSVVLLGGNQGDAVSVAAFARERVLGFRWPAAPDITPAPASGGADDEVFEVSLAHVLAMEGGYSDDPYDPGGPTNKGITLRELAQWRGVDVTAADLDRLRDELRRIDDATVRAIYRKRYWLPASCPELVPAVALMHFDAAVNHGIATANRCLQEAVGAMTDGEIGPETRAALARAPVGETIERYGAIRRRRYRALPHFWRFGRGWLNRVDKTLARSRELAPASGVPASIGSAPPIAPSTTITKQGAPDMSPTTTTTPDVAEAPNSDATTTPKWWGQSVTVWGALITALATVLPAFGPLIGLDITGEMVREAGGHVVTIVQALGGLLGTIMTIYGRARATQPLARRAVSLRL